MAERYKVGIKVAGQKGNCFQGHKVGDEWVSDGKTPEGICLSAFNSLFPYLQVLMFGGVFPWEADPDIASNVACPDSLNPVLFEIRRLRE